MTFYIDELKDGQEIGMNKLRTRKVHYNTNVHVRREGDKFILRSYSTDVCSFDLDRGLISFNGAYSRSTVTHIGGFFNLIVRNFDSNKTPILDAFSAVYINERIKSATGFYDSIKWINLKLGKYCVWERRSSEEDYKDRVYCY